MADIYQTDPSRLTKLAGLDESTKDLYRPEELGAIWRQQLEAPLAFDLETQIRDAKTTFADASAATVKPPQTFRELLEHPSPPLELLKLAKDFAKAHAHAKDGALPHDIALALYHVIIAAALLRSRQRITSLDDEGLRRGLEWVITQSWLDDARRALLQEVLNSF